MGVGSARAQPLIIATEDLHWADPTLELIQPLVEQGSGARLLLLYTARPSSTPHGYHGRIIHKST
jgi:predicted ATPase